MNLREKRIKYNKGKGLYGKSLQRQTVRPGRISELSYGEGNFTRIWGDGPHCGKSQWASLDMGRLQYSKYLVWEHFQDLEDGLTFVEVSQCASFLSIKSNYCTVNNDCQYFHLSSVSWIYYRIIYCFVLKIFNYKIRNLVVRC